MRNNIRKLKVINRSISLDVWSGPGKKPLSETADDWHDVRLVDVQEIKEN